MVADPLPLLRQHSIQHDQKHRSHSSTDRTYSKRKNHRSCKGKPLRTKSHKNDTGSDHGNQGGNPFELSKSGSNLPLLGQLHGYRIIERHEKVHTHRLDKQENQHHIVGRRTESKHAQSDHQQDLGHHCHAKVSQKAQRADQQHAQNARTFPGNFNKAPLNRIDEECLTEIVGNNVVSKSAGNSGKNQYQCKQSCRLLLSDCLHSNHLTYCK